MFQTKVLEKIKTHILCSVIFTYLGSDVNCDNDIRAEIQKSILAGNRCFRGQRKHLRSHLTSKNTKIFMYKILIRPVLTYESETRLRGVYPSFRMEQFGSHWMEFHEIRNLNIFRISLEKIQVSSKSDKNNRYFT